MKRLSILLLSLGLCAGNSLSHAADAPARPDGPPPQEGGAGGPGGGPRGGPGNGQGGGPGGFHLIPRFAEDKLNLTDDQRKQIGDLEKDTKEKLAKILTADQLKTLETSRPQRGPGGGGPGGGQGGGPGGGGPGGGGPSGGQGGGTGGPGGDQPPSDRPARPAK